MAGTRKLLAAGIIVCVLLYIAVWVSLSSSYSHELRYLETQIGALEKKNSMYDKERASLEAARKNLTIAIADEKDRSLQDSNDSGIAKNTTPQKSASSIELQLARQRELMQKIQSQKVTKAS